MTRLRWGFVGLFALAGCSTSAPSGGSASASGSAVESSRPAASTARPSSSLIERPETPPPAASSSAPPTGSAMPPLAGLKQLVLHQQGSGPNEKKCEGTELKLTVDLGTWRWIYGSCSHGADDPANASSLKVKNGTFSPEQRTQIEASYAKLSHQPALTCGADGAPLTLTLTRKDETSVSFVDENWKCATPPPEVANGIRDFSAKLVAIATTPPP